MLYGVPDLRLLTLSPTPPPNQLLIMSATLSLQKGPFTGDAAAFQLYKMQVEWRESH